MAELDISKLSQGVQNFIEKNNIDVDKSKTLNKTELANLLAATADQVQQSGDSYASSRANSANPAQLAENIRNLASVIMQIDEARLEDEDQFNMQIDLAHKFLKELKEKGTVDKDKVDELIYLLHKSSEGYQEKVGNRYDSLDDAINNVGAAFADPERPTGLLFHNDEQEKTQAKIKEFTKIQQNLTQEIRVLIDEGRFEDIKNCCEELLMQTHKFSEEMSVAMSELESFGLNALKEATQNLPGRNVPEEMKSISNLADTIGNISKEAKADMEQFKKFEVFLQEQLVKINDYIKNGIEDENKLKMQFEMMHETLETKVQQFAGRYDNVLDAFEKFEKNDKLQTKFDEVENDRNNAIQKYEDNSNALRDIVMKMIADVSEGKTERMEQLTKMIIEHMEVTKDVNHTSMEELEKKALEFIEEAINGSEGGTTAGISSTPASEQKATNWYDLNGRLVTSPKKGQLYIHDGKKVVYGE